MEKILNQSKILVLLALMIMCYARVDARADAKDHNSKINLAVQTFTGDGLTSEQLNALTIKFKGELFRYPQIVLIEQDKIDAVVEEREFQNTDCLTSNCRTKMGETMGAQKLIFGAIRKTGSLTTLEAKMVDIQTGKIEKIAIVDTKNSYAKILKKDIKYLGEKLMGESDSTSGVYQIDPTKNRPPIAVLKMEGKGLDSTELFGLTERLRVELFNTQKYDVLERAQMAKILDEQALQNSDECQNENCMVQIGKLIGVKYMVGGSCVRIGSMHSVSARIIDVETGQIIRTATVDMDGSYERILHEAMNDVARTLAGLELLKREKTTAKVWAGVAAVMVGTGVYFTLAANSSFSDYRSEDSDIERVQDLRGEVNTMDALGFTFYGGTGISVGMSTYYFLRKEKTVDVKSAEGVPNEK